MAQVQPDKHSQSDNSTEHDEQEILGKAFDRKLIVRLLRYLRPYIWYVVLLLLLNPVVVFLALLTPKLIQTAVDGPVPQGDTAALTRIAGTLLLVILSAAGLRLLQTYVSAWVAQKTVNRIRVALFRHLQNLSMSFYNRNPVGRLLTRVTGDVDALAQFYQEGIVNFFYNFLMMLGIMIALLLLHWRVALMVFSILPLVIYVTIRFKNQSRSAFRDMRLSIATVNTYLQENISGMQVVQVFNRQEKNANRFYQLAHEYYQKCLRAIYYFSIFFPIMDFVSAMGLTIALAAGAYFLGVEGITVGIVVATVIYTEQFFEPIREMTEKYNILQSAMASSERVFTILDETPAIPVKPDAVELSEFRGEIEFRNVWFAYKDDLWVLRDISLHIRPGEKVAFVGHTGAGKSTLVALLFRFYDVQQGQILIDGRDIRDYSLSSLRAAMGMVLQDVFLFRGNVLENIRLHNPDISLEKVQEVCRYVNIHSFIESLPQGYESMVEERGGNLSLGQRQLLAFARALVYQPDMLILDEATSNIDTETEALIQNALNRMIHDKNVIVIAHRLSTVEQVDCIFVLHHGQLQEQGSHQNLLKQRGLYYRLYQLQYQKIS